MPDVEEALGRVIGNNEKVELFRTCDRTAPNWGLSGFDCDHALTLIDCSDLADEIVRLEREARALRAQLRTLLVDFDVHKNFALRLYRWLIRIGPWEQDTYVGLKQEGLTLLGSGVQDDV